MSILQSLPGIITAIGGLGTAAFGLVDSTKALPLGGVNRIGFSRIAGVVTNLTPGAPASGLTQGQILATLKANWYNGTDLGSQKSIAKSLIKQGLNGANAAALANVAGVDPAVLQSVAAKITSGTPLEQNESDVYARFDFILTALLDEVYQIADQAYTNGTRIVASIFALALALAGGSIVHANLGVTGCYWGWHSNEMWTAVVAGVLATPLAPIAKDLSSALATAVNTLQSMKS